MVTVTESKISLRYDSDLSRSLLTCIREEENVETESKGLVSSSFNFIPQPSFISHCFSFRGSSTERINQLWIES